MAKPRRTTKKRPSRKTRGKRLVPRNEAISAGWYRRLTDIPEIRRYYRLEED